MNLTTRSLRLLAALAMVGTFLFANHVTPSFAGTATCSNPNTLAGSGFEIDGNLPVNGPGVGCSDWVNNTASGAPNGSNSFDVTSSSTDNMFGQGTKEDSTSPTVVLSKPDPKNDLSNFMIGSETNAGQVFVYLAWQRISTNGSANEDFELNQKPSFFGASGQTPGILPLNRTAGDILLQYNFSGSGTPTLTMWRWDSTLGDIPPGGCLSNKTAPCWGTMTLLPPAIALAAVSPDGSFGETAVNLTSAGIFNTGGCETLGSAWLKGRSSFSPSAELKDFVAPIGIDITNCATITIVKSASPTSAGTTFPYTTTSSTSTTLNGGSFSLDGSNTALTGSRTFNNLLPGTYTVAEGSTTGWDFTGLSCTPNGSTASASISVATATITLTPSSSETCTYSNTEQQGAIKITKTDSATKAALAGAHFEICTNPGPYTVGSPCVAVTGGSNLVTLADGTVCLGGLAFATYYVKETAAPSNYNIDDNTIHTATVNTNGTCANPSVTIAFTDTPQVGAILITKTSSKSAHPVLAGAKFSVDGGADLTTNASGTICVTGLSLGTHHVQETHAPTGYAIDDTGNNAVTVVGNTDCASANVATVNATDTPLTDLTATATSEVAGGTQSTINCVDSGNTNVATSGPNSDPATASVTGLKPGTYTCTVVIDP